MDLEKRYRSLSLIYQSTVLEREIHEDAMKIGIEEFMQCLNETLDLLDQNTKDTFNRIIYGSPVANKESQSPAQTPPPNEPQEACHIPTEEKHEPSAPTEPPPEAPTEDFNQEPTPTQEPKTLEGKYKKMFREVALLLHPDRLLGKDEKEKKKKTELFKSVQSALTQGDYGTLFFAASQLDVIPKDLTNEDLDFLINLTSEEEKKIANIRNSWAWIWLHADSATKKDDIMLKYIEKSIQERKERDIRS